MTKLIQRMREELVRRNYAETTIRSYLQAMEDFWRFIEKRLDQVSSEEIRKYQVHLLEERKLEPGTVAYRVAALRFFSVRTLKRLAMKADLPYPDSPKHGRRLETAWPSRSRPRRSGKPCKPSQACGTSVCHFFSRTSNGYSQTSTIRNFFASG